MNKTLNFIMEKMEEIKYGFVDVNNNVYHESDENWNNFFPKYYRLQSPKSLLETKCGVCCDQVELERYYFKENNINYKTYFIVEYDGKIFPTHTFIVACLNDKYYHFEHSWEPHKGIHEYESLESLLKGVKEKFAKMLIKENISPNEIVIYEYKEPESGLDIEEFYRHCESGNKIDI